jgi:hypothetical protein
MDEDGYEVYSFQDMNLLPGMSVRVEAEDGLSNNQAIRLNEAQSLAQIGLFTDPATGLPDMGKFCKVARLKIPGIVPDATSTEYAAAMAAIKKIEDGEQAPMPAAEDDVNIFANTILSWMRGKGRQYRDQGREDIYQNVMMLWQQYIQILMQQVSPSGDPAAEGGPASGASPPGSDTSAPGGTPNSVAAQSSTTQGSVNGDAATMVSKADQAGEAAVRQNKAHES